MLVLGNQVTGTFAVVSTENVWPICLDISSNYKNITIIFFLWRMRTTCYILFVIDVLKVTPPYLEDIKIYLVLFDHSKENGHVLHDSDFHDMPSDDMSLPSHHEDQDYSSKT